MILWSLIEAIRLAYEILYGIHIIRLRIYRLKKGSSGNFGRHESWKGEITKNRQAKRTEINLDDRFQTIFVSNEFCYCLI